MAHGAYKANNPNPVPDYTKRQKRLELNFI